VSTGLFILQVPRLMVKTIYVWSVLLSVSSSFLQTFKCDYLCHHFPHDTPAVRNEVIVVIHGASVSRIAKFYLRRCHKYLITSISVQGRGQSYNILIKL
jgi:hypothetical protein